MYSKFVLPNWTGQSYAEVGQKMTCDRSLLGTLDIMAVLMIRVEKCPDICFPIVNLLTSPLIMYSKFVWSNLV